MANASFYTITAGEYWDTSSSRLGYSDRAAVPPGTNGGGGTSLGDAKVAVSKTAIDVVFDFYLGGTKRSSISLLKSTVTFP